MGTFYHSQTKTRPTPEQVSADIADLVASLWPDHPTKYRVVQTEGIPVTPEDTRVARWEFWLRDWDEDCAFTMSLLNDGRMEFKVPRSQWDEWYDDQQKLRRRLVKRWNA